MDMIGIQGYGRARADGRRMADSSGGLAKGLAMDGGSPLASTESMQALEQVVDQRGPLLRLPEPAETHYLFVHRKSAVQLRMLLCLLPAFVFCVLAVVANSLLDFPEQLTTMMRVVGLGIVVPASVLAASVVQSAPERPASGVAVASNGLVLVLALEWLRARGVAVDHGFDHAVIACIPTALVLFGGFRARCVISIVVGYLATTAVTAVALDMPPASVITRLGELVLLLLVASTAIGMESRQRRNWVMRQLIEHQAHRDPLTGLRNRRSFEQFFAMAASQARREGKSLCFAMVDLDHFKQINDLYGHAHGDTALRQVAMLLAKFERRPLDAIARLGGEEFGILLYDCNHVSALQRLHDLAQALHGSDISNEGAPHGRLTMSVGGTVADGSAPLSALLAEADRRLYEVKNQGRNGVRVSSLLTA